MDREEAIEILRAHAGELRARGVTRLAIFGSTARGEAGPESDIDVLVDIDEDLKFSLIDLAGLRLYLCDLLDREVELAQRKGLKPFLRDNILAEAVEIFPRFDGRPSRSKGMPMRRRSPRQRLQDVMDAIKAIEASLADRSLDDYRADEMLRAATERRIEIISEASYPLPDALKDKHADIPWRQVADIGNILRHGYEIIDQEIVWNVATRDLGPLKAAVEAMIREVEEESG
ncbi:MAG: HepT-like ribonuclease domain-containing protein [Kiloniellaceae bacterium]